MKDPNAYVEYVSSFNGAWDLIGGQRIDHISFLKCETANVFWIITTRMIVWHHIFKFLEKSLATLL